MLFGQSAKAGAVKKSPACDSERCERTEGIRKGLPRTPVTIVATEAITIVEVLMDDSVDIMDMVYTYV